MKDGKKTKSYISAVFFFAIALTGSSLGQLKTIYQFTSADGGPGNGLILDAAGNVYGTTPYGGTYGLGEAYQLSPAGGGQWSETVLYNFSFFGFLPKVVPLSTLLFDTDGNLYGTTEYGGIARSNGNGGSVFKLSPPTQSGLPWTATSLTWFHQDSYQPWSPRTWLIRDASGSLLGTTDDGGSYGGGTIFKLTKPKSAGPWDLSVLYNFCSVGNDCLDGHFPSGLISDANGNLYGTTRGGGLYDYGTVFGLSPNGSGGWVESVLYSFCSDGGRCRDGQNPSAGLTLDSAGNLYGTTADGGTSGKGTVFMLTQSGTTWTEKVLYSFKDSPDGAHPMSGVVFDSTGSLYGTCIDGGSGGGIDGGGILFELIPGAGGWTEKNLVQFQGNNGYHPLGNLTMDSAGNLYGVTLSGGTTNIGTAFQFTP